MEKANGVLQDQEQSITALESDTQKIVRRHLEDPNHVITEEELKNIRIGITLPVTDANGYEEKKPLPNGKEAE